MPRLSKKQLAKILTSSLHLADPQFVLETDGAKIYGSIISPTFRGKTDYRRQIMMLDALEEALGARYLQVIGMLLAFTPEEWNIDLDAYHRPRGRARKAG